MKPRNQVVHWCLYVNINTTRLIKICLYERQLYGTNKTNPDILELSNSAEDRRPLTKDSDDMRKGDHFRLSFKLC